MSDQEDLAFTLTFTAAAGVASQPRVELERWRVLETEAEQFLSGFLASSGKGRCTSPLVEIDFRTMQARTASGRVYDLVGPPATKAEAALLLLIAAANRDAHYVRDVTDELLSWRCNFNLH